MKIIKAKTISEEKEMVNNFILYKYYNHEYFVMDKMHQYRQPIVTATGIFLGFMLNFTSSWLPNAFTKQIFKDTFVAISILLCIPLLVIVLFRILRMNYPADSVDKYYTRTLTYFLIAVTIPFIAFLVVIIERFIVNVI